MSSRKLFSILVRAFAGLGLAMLMLIPASLASAASGGATASSSSTLFGATISSSADLALKTTEFGHMPIVRVYYPGLPSSNAWTTGLPAANKSDVIVSFKALPTDILSGADDATLEHFFDTAPTGHTIYYTYYHEPEDNIAAGDFTLSDYLAAWAHVVKLADAANNPDLHSALILMAWDFDPHSGRTWTNYLPPGHIISTIVWDAYPNNTGLGTPDPATSPSFMGSAVAASKAAGLPFGFAEFNTTTIPGRPAWYTAVGAYCESSGALFCTLYDDSYNGGLGGSGTFYVTDAASENAWKAVVSGSGTPTTPPTVPTGLSATAISGTEVKLSWTASTDTVGVTGYNIYRGISQVGTSATTSYSDAGLTDATSYQYSVSAYDAAGLTSANSTSVSVTTPDTEAPTVPTGLTATAVSGTKINLSWTASTDNVRVTGYDIYRFGTEVATSGTTSYSDTGLTPATSYEYTVSAFDAAGNASAKSSIVSATTLDTILPTVPTDLKASAMSSGTQVNLSWDASSDSLGVAGYVIYRNGAQIGTSATPAYADTTVTDATSYQYTVSAKDTAGNTSGQSSPVSVTTPDTEAPTVPQGLSATAVSGTKINLSWTPSTDNIWVTGYDIYENSNLVGTSTTAAYSATGLTASTSYEFAVSAFDAAGNVSLQSPSVSATTLSGASPPSPPTNLAGAAWFSQIWLRWSASVDSGGTVAGYNVFRDGALVGVTTHLDYFDGHLSAGTTYHYTVEAFDSAGNVSGPSASLTLKTLVQHSRTLLPAASPPTLHLNESAFGVEMMQYGLQRLGFYSRKGAVNGHYGSVTNAAVRAFQKRYHGLPSRSGSQFGPANWEAMTRAHASASSMPTLVPNERSLGVEIMQFGLKQLGFYPPAGALNGWYGPVTSTAVQAFQRLYDCRPATDEARFGAGSWIALTHGQLS